MKTKDHLTTSGLKNNKKTTNKTTKIRKLEKV